MFSVKFSEEGRFEGRLEVWVEEGRLEEGRLEEAWVEGGRL